MIRLSAGQIAEATAAERKGGTDEAIVDSITIDSRLACPGACFFAIAGDRLDGHEFAAQAIGGGAGVVVVHRALADAPESVTVLRVEDTTAALQSMGSWLRDHLDPVVVAVTGSLGKTTTKELTAALLGARYNVHASPGNLNNHWGVPLSLLGLEPHHDVMVAELAMSDAGEIRALARLTRPDVGIVTNVAPAHMENFSSLDEVAAAKGELAEELGESATLIVNADDPHTLAMAAAHGARVARVLRFGTDPSADVRASNARISGPGWAFDLHIADEIHRVELGIPGAAGISSFLAAAACAIALDVEIDAIVSMAPSLRPLSNRGAIREIDGITLLDESYNASPYAVRGALETFAAIPTKNRRIVVLGDMLEMGDWSERTHREAGADVAAAGADLLLAVGTFAELVAAGAAAAGMNSASLHVFSSADEAASWLAPRLTQGDTLMVKGSRAVGLERVVDAVTSFSAVSNGVGDN